MRKIIFYRLNNGKCPIEDYLDSLSQKQVEKIFFVLYLIEQLNMVPRKFFKKLEATDNIWEARVQQKEIKKAEKRKKEYFLQRRQG
jgi:K+ transporter